MVSVYISAICAVSFGVCLYVGFGLYYYAVDMNIACNEEDEIRRRRDEDALAEKKK